MTDNMHDLLYASPGNMHDLLYTSFDASVNNMMRLRQSYRVGIKYGIYYPF